MNSTSLIQSTTRFNVKDPISALTHFIGFIAAIIGMPILLLYASRNFLGMTGMISLAVFMMSMILLYGASASYHAFNISEQGNKMLKRVDHMMIFILIAGSYTPVCLLALSRESGVRLLICVWVVAFIGIVFKAVWVTCPKWVSSVIYIGMGWLCVTASDEIFASFKIAPLAWLVAGGVIYTIGGVIYALKIPVLSNHFENFGAHELFHLFVMGGSFCHYMTMMYLV